MGGLLASLLLIDPFMGLANAVSSNGEVLQATQAPAAVESPGEGTDSSNGPARCIILARGFGGRRALMMSPRQLKEVIQWHIQTLVRSRLKGAWLVARFIVSPYLGLAGMP